MTATRRVIALVREHLRAPDDLAARLALQAIALEVARLEVSERLLSGLLPGTGSNVESLTDRRAFEVAMDALSLERSGLEVAK